jgi:hypothetical protein
MTVRDAGRRFQQQMYVKALERLGRALGGHEVGGALSPSERPIHAMLLAVAPETMAATAAAAAPSRRSAPPDSPAVAHAETVAEAPVLSGPERRTSRRIQMKTRVRIRRDAERDSESVAEVLEPLNLSRGGVGFQSSKRFALHETVWVTMHYQPGSAESKALAADGAAEMETKAIIVRAAPLADGAEFSYGLRFL